MFKKLFALIIISVAIASDVTIRTVEDDKCCDGAVYCDCWRHGEYKEGDTVTLRHFGGKIHVCAERVHGDVFDIRPCLGQWCGPCCMTLMEYLHWRYPNGDSYDAPGAHPRVAPTPPPVSTDN